MTANLVASSEFCRDDLAGWRRISVDGWNWRVRPDHWDGLHDHSVLNPLNPSVGTVIKRGPHRTVRRVDASSADGTYFVKIFHRSDWRARWKQWLRGEPASWEFSRYRIALRRQIPTAEVVAIGTEAGRSGCSALVTQGIDEVTPLDEWFRHRTVRVTSPLRRALAEELGELIARMHSRGVIHRDLHAGNILLRHRALELRLWLVDLAPLRFLRSSPTAVEIAQDLGRLRHSLLEQLCLTDQAAFFQAYWRQFTGNLAGRTPPWHGDQHFAWRDLTQRCDRVARTAWNEMDRAWARGNSKQIVITAPHFHCRGLARLGRERLEALCRFTADNDDSDETIALSRGRMPAPDGEQSLQIVTKSVTATENSWARHCWNIGHALECRWIAAPVPVYMLDDNSPTAPRQEIAYVKDSAWKPLWNMLGDGLTLQDIAPRAVDLVNRFHELGFTHAALGFSAFEARQVEGRWQCRFASLEPIRLAGSVSLSQRCADLQPLVTDLAACPEFSSSTRLRWLKRYLGSCGNNDWKSCWRMFSSADHLTISQLRAA